MSMPIF